MGKPAVWMDCDGVAVSSVPVGKHIDCFGFGHGTPLSESDYSIPLAPESIRNRYALTTCVRRVEVPVRAKEGELMIARRTIGLVSTGFFNNNLTRQMEVLRLDG